ncbi:DMT family transporter [Paenibacillus sp. NPDC058071]|uniref:DMT family transporter n=1 Tax=Paenibacillus sp. NPDC058071 TaxID=3346326 RepID=UPI0036DCEE19
MAWVYLIIAGLLEVAWTFGLKHSQGFTVLWPSIITIILIVASFVVLAKVMQVIEVGTAYAIFTGMGTAGTVILGIAMGESADPLKLLFIGILIIGIIGLKLVSGEKSDDSGGRSGGGSKAAVAAGTGKERN